MTKSDEMKSMNFRMPKETWLLVKKMSMEKEISMTQVILQCIEKNRKKEEKS